MILGFSKKETTLVLATAVILMLMVTVVAGAYTGFATGNIKMSQDQFNQAWQFTTVFAGAALMYFGFRAGQSNGSSVTQS